MHITKFWNLDWVWSRRELQLYVRDTIFGWILFCNINRNLFNESVNLRKPQKCLLLHHNLLYPLPSGVQVIQNHLWRYFMKILTLVEAPEIQQVIPPVEKHFLEDFTLRFSKSVMRRVFCCSFAVIVWCHSTWRIQATSIEEFPVSWIAYYIKAPYFNSSVIHDNISHKYTEKALFKNSTNRQKYFTNLIMLIRIPSQHLFE